MLILYSKRLTFYYSYIEITSEISGMAPIPELSVGVRQGNNLIGDTLTVAPGEPLQMEVCA